MDASQIDKPKYTHIHFAFALWARPTRWKLAISGLSMSLNSSSAHGRTIENQIISIGGWVISTDPKMYHISRRAMTSANLQLLAANIAACVNQHALDGVDID